MAWARYLWSQVVYCRPVFFVLFTSLLLFSVLPPSTSSHTNLSSSLANSCKLRYAAWRAIVNYSSLMIPWRQVGGARDIKTTVFKPTSRNLDSISKTKNIGIGALAADTIYPLLLKNRARGRDRPTRGFNILLLRLSRNLFSLCVCETVCCGRFPPFPFPVLSSFCLMRPLGEKGRAARDDEHINNNSRTDMACDYHETTDDMISCGKVPSCIWNPSIHAALLPRTLLHPPACYVSFVYFNFYIFLFFLLSLKHGFVSSLICLVRGFAVFIL